MRVKWTVRHGYQVDHNWIKTAEDAEHYGDVVQWLCHPEWFTYALVLKEDKSLHEVFLSDITVVR